MLALIQPALVEDSPRRLLYALTHGLPVIATDACGLAGYAGVSVVPYGDATALQQALENLLH